MTRKNLSHIILLFVIGALPAHANAGIVTHFDGSNETEVNGSDQTSSIVTTSSVTNSVYDTRSFAIAGNQNVAPHESGVIPDNNLNIPPINGHMYMRSAVTKTNPTINQTTSAYHDFKVTVNDSQLDLDTLSFNYWATEAEVNDSEGPTDYTYEVRAHALLTDATGAPLPGQNGYSNLTLKPTSGNRVLQIQNPNNTALNTPRSNVVEFDLSSLGTLTAGQMVNLRLSFADYGTNGGVGPDDGSHIHRLDNVQIEATTAVPEPSALCLLIGSIGILGLRRRR